jgi:hypothetical protein
MGAKLQAALAKAGVVQVRRQIAPGYPLNLRFSRKRLLYLRKSGRIELSERLSAIPMMSLLQRKSADKSLFLVTGIWTQA